MGPFDKEIVGLYPIQVAFPQDQKPFAMSWFAPRTNVLIAERSTTIRTRLAVQRGPVVQLTLQDPFAYLRCAPIVLTQDANPAFHF